MYPPEWWWAERQVSEVLAENPGELVKTGPDAIYQLTEMYISSENNVPFRFPEYSVLSPSKPLEIEQDPSFGFQSDRIE